MFLENLKDQLIGRLQSYWDSLRESSAYIQASERYAGYPRSTQILIVVGLCGLLALFLFLFPNSYIESAREQYALYEETADLIRDLDKVNREAGELENLPKGLASAEMSNLIRSALDRARLQPDQIVSVEGQSMTKDAASEGKGLLWKSFPAEQVIANLKKLNLRQVVEIGRNVETLPAGLVLLDLALTATPDDPHYFDAVYTFASFQLAADVDKPAPRAAKPARFKGR